MKIRTASAVGCGAIAIAGTLYGLDLFTAPIRARHALERSVVRQAMTREQAVDTMRLFAERGGTRGDRRRFFELVDVAGEAWPKEELLTLAATYRHPEVMSWLLVAGALPGGGGHPAAPLLASARAGDVRGLRLLLVAGAAPDPQLTKLDRPSHPTPLVAAICSGSLDCVDELLAAGADPHRPFEISRNALNALQYPTVPHRTLAKGPLYQRMTALQLARRVRNPTMALIVERERAPQKTAGRLALDRP